MFRRHGGACSLSEPCLEKIHKDRLMPHQMLHPSPSPLQIGSKFRVTLGPEKVALRRQQGSDVLFALLSLELSGVTLRALPRETHQADQSMLLSVLCHTTLWLNWSTSLLGS